MRKLFCLLTSVALLASIARAERLRISGRVELGGPFGGRAVRVQVSRDFPDSGGTVEASAVTQKRRFFFDRLQAGNYWLVAYVDTDQDGKLTPGKDIVGYARENPIPLGEGRCCFQTTIELDPISVEVITRFVPKQAMVPASQQLVRIRVMPFNPRTGQFLRDAEVLLSGKRLPFDSRSGSFLYIPTGPEEARSRYRVEVLDPALGKKPEPHLVAPRKFGAVPEVKIEGPTVSWTRPPWANLEEVKATSAAGKVLFEGPARSPLALGPLGPGTVVRVRIGRVDVQHAGDTSVAFGETVLTVPDDAKP